MSTTTTIYPKLIFGAGCIGNTAKSFTYTWGADETVSDLLAKLKSLDILELDSAASYPPGNPRHTETLLGQANATNEGFIIDSKVLAGGALNERNITDSVNKTLRLLGTSRIRILYAHGPDLTTPFEETATAFNKLFLEGKVEKLNTSIFGDAKGYVKPSIYQGHYNALIRGYGETLIPVLRKHGLAYYAFSPLGGGFLTGKVTFASANRESLARTRFTGDSTMQYFVNTFDKPEAHNALRALNEECQENVCLRWLIHHSALGSEDAIIMGAKRLDQLESNVADCRKGPLPQSLVNAIEKMSKGGLMHESTWQ